MYSVENKIEFISPSSRDPVSHRASLIRKLRALHFRYKPDSDFRYLSHNHGR